jgi:hypothetical protein
MKTTPLDNKISSHVNFNSKEDKQIDLSRNKDIGNDLSIEK